jgi:hypothetical protein
MLPPGRSRVRIPMRLISFSLPNLSSRTMALRSTQPLIEMSSRNLPGGKERPGRKADHLTAICEPMIEKTREPRRHTTLWVFTASYRDSFTFFYPALDAQNVLHEIQCIPRHVSSWTAASVERCRGSCG